MANAALNPAHNVSVSASAGTGKTWLLTARITRILLEGHRADGILALTFTRKAAAEMRERVSAHLQRLAQADEASLLAQLAQLELEPTAEVRRNARRLHEELLFSPWPLRAMTLHAFCQDLVSRFALQCGIAPGFELVEGEAELLGAAWQRLQNELLAAADGLPAQALRTLIAAGYNERALRGSVMSFLQRRNDWRSYIEGQSDGLAYLDQQLRRRLKIAEDIDPVAALDAPAYSARLKILLQWLQRLGGVGLIKPDRLEPALGLSGNERLAALTQALFKKDGDPYELKFSKTLQARLSAEELTHVQQTHSEVTAQVMAARDQRLRTLTWRRTQAACTLGVAALACLEDELKRRGVLPFAELEWQAYRLLSEPDTGNWVQYKLDQRVDHLLVDEFQDTSNTQWQLLLPLLQEMAAGESGRGRSAFIVGDIKQSIYGFRRANPELMPLADRWLHEHLRGTRQALSASWRSAPAIINFVNALFALPEAQRLVPDFPAHSTHRQDDWGRVELARLVDAGEVAEKASEAFRNPLSQKRDDVENTRALREGRLIAQRINALIKARHEISDHGQRRALSYGDIMILLRRRTHQQALERALTELNIPFTGAARGTLLDTVEARDLTALLRFLNSPGRDLDLAHALRSPIFGASDEDLVALAVHARKYGCGWFEALNADPAPGALQRARALLAQWIGAARALPAHDLLDRIYSEANAAARYEAALPAVPAARVRANLNAYIQLALEVDSGRYPSLSKFLRYLQQAAVGDAPDEAPPPSSGDQVRIMTIHAAKGLEAPAVFLAQAASLPKNDGAGWLVDWPHGEHRPTEFILGGSADERDAHTRCLVAARAEREAREEMNLLYVALTRARQFLHISGFASKRNSKELSWYDLALDAFEALGVSADAAGLHLYAQGEPAQASVAEVMAAQTPVDPRLRQICGEQRPIAGPPGASGQDDHDAAAARRGTAIHFLLQQLSEQPAVDEARLRKRLQARLRLEFSGAEFAQWLAEARGVLKAPALARFFTATQYQRAWNEVPLHYGEVTGIMDRLVDDGERLWILDYKTHRGTDTAPLLAEYQPQLRAYRDGVQRLWPGREVRAGLVLTASAQWVQLP